MGTKGYIDGSEGKLRILDFNSGQWEEIEMETGGGHSGGDEGLMNAFIQTIKTGNEKYSLTGPDVTLESHLIVFAAEQARLDKRVVEMKEYFD
jgi:predicted dehydrogenase